MDTKRTRLFEGESVLSAVMALAVPSIIGQLILVIYNMADTFFIGLMGNDAMLATVAVCMPAFMVISAISNLFGVGAASVISRALGKQNPERAKNAFSFAVWGCIVFSVIYFTFAFLFKDNFVDILGGSPLPIHDKAVEYLLVTVVICGIPTCLNTLFSHLIRSEGHSVHASLGIMLGGVLNIALDPLFIFCILPPEKATLGAALATGISNVVAFLYYVIYFIVKRKESSFSIKPKKEMFSDGIPKAVIGVGIPAFLMTLCENISYAVLDNLMAYESIAAQAGIGVAKKINMFAHSAVRGMAQGVLPLIGYNKSSGNRKRMKAVTLTSGAISLGISLVATACFLLFSKPLTALFIQVDDTGSLEYGAAFLKILCLGAPLSAVAYTTISFFQAVGAAYRSLVLALLRKGLLDIPLMFVLRLFIPIYGIVWATPIADGCAAVTAVILLLIYLKHHGKNKGRFK